MTPVLSVITPVYNAAKTMEKSLQSIRCAQPEKVELVFVDDGSTDGTSSILASYIEKSPFRCKCIRQDNQGAAAARNNALNHAEGEFLIFLDADDRFVPDALDRILQLLKEDMDILGWDWTHEQETGTRSMRQAEYCTPEQALKNLMGGTMKWNLWLYAVKRELVDKNGVRFVPGADMGEDMGLMLKAFACASRVKQVHEPLYVYNACNPASISTQLNQKRRDQVTENLHSAETFLLNSPYTQLAQAYLPHLKLFIKLPLLIGFSKKDYQLWNQWMPEANAFAAANKALPFRTRFLQWMASKRLYPGVWAYNVLYKWLIRLRFS